jgi:LPS export ABC transporter protein LptC
MSPRTIIVFVFFSAGAIGSWYLARPANTAGDDDLPFDSIHRGYYLKDARILGTGDDGSLLYEIEAQYAEQMQDKRIEFTAVRIRYSPHSDVPWTVNADAATVAEGSPRITLRGNVYALSVATADEEKTEILTQYLEFDPEHFVAQTDARVEIRFGARSLTATGMLASFIDDEIELKSNVRGKFVP